MSVVILKPHRASPTYEKSALVFKEMYEKVTGKIINIVDKDDGKSDLFVIGSDAVNDFVMNEVIELRIDSLGIRYGTDDYCIRSLDDKNRNVLILAGGRGRSTLYAIYDYFERYLNCHYFWDGDVLPHSDIIPMREINVVESPRFQYRGLRYFAHRGLKRFQAEHWSFEDWKQELDWMVKKRLNFFMLRIGMDDVWQRAFPDDVPYPEKYMNIEGVDAKGFDDRSDFWTLKYRGELREKILEYARLLDLTYPTDCGTMTHWYSRTPEAFLKNKNPEFVHQDCGHSYSGSDTGRVWNFMNKDEMDNYVKLTQTMVDEYDKRDELFHTIGLGERRLYSDKNKNLASKLIAYRRIAENIREKYPNSKLMLASWDLAGWWTCDEVQKLISELDPERTIILDYTSEVRDPNESFLNWGIVNKFPWIFGLFHAYESENELRGPYDRIDERLKIAAEDECCKGMILWPELSHSDPLILEYLSQNAWSPLEKSIGEITENFCKNRYGKHSKKMNQCWQNVLPFIKLYDWGGFHNREPEDENYIEYCVNGPIHRNVWHTLTRFLKIDYENFKVITDYHNYILKMIMPLIENIIDALNLIADNNEAFEDDFVLRDSIDIARTVLGKFMNLIIFKAVEKLEDKAFIQTVKQLYIKAIDVMEELLSLNSDFSLYDTLKYLETVAPTNPDFEITLKRNIYNYYCCQPAYELVAYIFKDECDVAFDWLMTTDGKNVPDFSEAMNVINKRFMDTPLKEMQPVKKVNPKDVFMNVASVVGEMANICEN